MNTLERKKLNLLIHLAKIDGKFEKSERELLKKFIQEKGLSEGSLDEEEVPMRFSDFSDGKNKIELLYWALKLIQADGLIHDKELLFCKNLATKLNFKEGIIVHFASHPLQNYETFALEVSSNWMPDL